MTSSYRFWYSSRPFVSFDWAVSLELYLFMTSSDDAEFFFVTSFQLRNSNITSSNHQLCKIWISRTYDRDLKQNEDFTTWHLLMSIFSTSTVEQTSETFDNGRIWKYPRYIQQWTLDRNGSSKRPWFKFFLHRIPLNSESAGTLSSCILNRGLWPSRKNKTLLASKSDHYVH